MKISLGEMKIPDLDRHRGKVLLITGVRVMFFLAILVISILFQLRQNTFFNTESIFPLFEILFVEFVLNTIYLSFFERAQRLWQPTAVLFICDAIFITALILITGVQQSIFLFLYLVNIILTGFIFQRRGAFLLALFTSACFSFILILGPEIEGQTLYFAVGLNNLAFFCVAALSGYLSEQLNFVGSELVNKKRDIKALTDLNKIIVENISSGLITVSSDYRVLLCNKSAIKILNLNKLIDRSLDEIFPNMTSTLTRSAGNRFERKYTLPNGDKLILGMSVSPLLDSAEQANGYIIIFQDLTEIVRLENAMRRQEKLAAVGKLAAGIAHEIRNPLASISGSIELLQSLLNIKGGDEGRLMDIMLKEISRLNQLITEFLEFVRPTERTLTPCHVETILNEVLDMTKVNTALNQGVTQKRNLLAPNSYVLGDVNKLKQVFLNLVINAYQAMGDSINPVLNVETISQGDLLIVKFRDTGAGMSDQTMRRLFEPFFTTKSKGTGLGLATVHKILEIHDDKIFVESHEGQGTEFTIQFHQELKEGANQYEGQNTGS